MPKFLEDVLKREYPSNAHAVFGTLNKIGAMHGNKETAKGRAMQAKHDRDVKSGKAKGYAKGGVVKPARKMHPNSLKNLTAPRFQRIV